MSRIPIYAVCFDMDNTLVETEWAAARAVKQVVESFGHAFSKADENAVIGLPWETIFNNAVNGLGLPISIEAFKTRVLDAKAAIMQDDPHTCPGAVEALRRCAECVPVAIVSGSFRHEIEDTVRVLDIAEKVKFIVANEDVQPAKPAPGPYLEAARQFGVKPENMLVFEDSEVGIEAAKAAGAVCVAVEYANRIGMNLSHADLQIPSLLSVNDGWLADMNVTTRKDTK